MAERREMEGGRETGRDKDTDREMQEGTEVRHTHIHPDGQMQGTETDLQSNTLPCPAEDPPPSLPSPSWVDCLGPSSSSAGHQHQRPKATHSPPDRGGALTDGRRRRGSLRWREGSASHAVGQGRTLGGCGLGIQGVGVAVPRVPQILPTPHPAPPSPASSTV